MAGRKRKCKICEKWIEDNNDSIPYKNGYAHKECFNIAMKAVVTERKEVQKKDNPKPKPQKELKEGLSEEEYQEKKQLCEYIRNLTHEDISIATYKLIDDYKKKYKITYLQMLEDLNWYFELCDHDIESDLVVGVIPYCHDEAQEYYQSIKQSNASCQDKIDQLVEMYKETTAIASKDRKRSVPVIDVAAIGGDK